MSDFNVPIGTILLWDQAVIPEKYSLCDGGTYNGITTPDCRNKFIWACSYDANLKTTGGTLNHTHSWSGETGNAGAHNHNSWSGNTNEPDSTEGSYEGYLQHVYVASYNHRHSINVSFSESGIHAHAMGAITEASHIPPHIKLCYIMKTQE
ncbi:MAG: hypothetical protein ACOX8S_12455 [Christensenellales bacterium]|jgi:hypothetical protein